MNGLDPDGIHWVRTLMRTLAAEGRTVLVSSHLMSEMALTADHLLVIGKGRLIADTSVDELVRSSSQQSVHVRSPQAAELAARCREAGATVRAGSTSRAATAPAAGPDAGTEAGVWPACAFTYRSRPALGGPCESRASTAAAAPSPACPPATFTTRG